jgi:hypothetical protein
VGHPEPIHSGSTVTETWRFRAPPVAGTAELRIDYWYVNIFGSDLDDTGDHQWAIADFTSPNPVFGAHYAQALTFTTGTPQWSGIAYYLDQYGNDTTGTGTSAAPFATMDKTLAAIKAAYASGTDWPTQSGSPVPVTIRVSGTITAHYPDTYAMVDLREAAAFPPIILAGKSAAAPGTLNADFLTNTYSSCVYLMNNNTATLAANLTITGAYAGICAEAGSTFTMTGGTIYTYFSVLAEYSTIDIRTVPPITYSYSSTIPNSYHIWP